MIFVIDNSVVMRWFFGDGKARDLSYANSVLDHLKVADAIVPCVWSLEVANVISRAEAQGIVTEARSEAFLEMLAGIDIKTDSASIEHAMTSTLNLARRYKLSSYDASYLELASKQGVALATLDTDLRKAAKKIGVKILLA
ncbi:MAG: type II toxin-antitoxin system VapC family toxin [Sideroxydans sp.]